ncbi:MAG: hypothetical protein QOI12_1090 [Alphaproteobacteria bacterium]|jgi:hypothetical protein|nr:hypothetical protein [Alphaproteobacteria bacterium]
MHPFELWRHWIEANALALEANCVIAMRVARLAGGGPLATAEAQRMVSEKMTAMAASQVATGLAVATGGTLGNIYNSACAPFRKRVRANRRRLAKSRQ